MEKGEKFQMSENFDLIGALVRLYKITDETPHQVVLSVGDINTVLAPGSVCEHKQPWGTKRVEVEKDGDFTVITSGPNVSYDVKKFGKHRQFGGTSIGEAVISCEPIKK